MKIEKFAFNLFTIKLTTIFIILCTFTFQASAQHPYSPSIQQFIDYKQDTIALTHCDVADVIHKKFFQTKALLLYMV